MEQDTTISSKRIAKNSLLLYIRMMFIMVISLFTSRVVLNALGVTDYGIYNVVGGFISMFTVLSGSFSASISRFITYELGRNDEKRLNSIFSTSVNIQIVISIIVVVISEFLGIWFLYYHMNIPVDRISAANWVLQCAIISFVINLISVPYNAEIIAHEKMGAYAAISMFDAFLKLVIAYLLLISPFDKLKYYSVLFVVVSLIIRFAYGIYCKRKFKECAYHCIIDFSIFKEMGKFAGWNLLGSTTLMCNTQGVNLLMNVYFGVIVNSARGLATQVDVAVKAFINSFMTAITPQITKSYAANDFENMYMLVCRGAKFSSFLFLLFAIPLIIETPLILRVWLNIVPEYTIIFSRLAIFTSFIDSVLGNSLWAAIISTGDIKKYQIFVSFVGIMVFPLSWICFKLGCSPASTYIVFIIVYMFVLFVRLYFMKKMLGMPISRYLSDVILPVLPVLTISFISSLILENCLEEGVIRFVVIIFFATSMTLIMSYTFGINRDERSFINSKVSNFFAKLLLK